MTAKAAPKHRPDGDVIRENTIPGPTGKRRASRQPAPSVVVSRRGRSYTQVTLVVVCV